MSPFIWKGDYEQKMPNTLDLKKSINASISCYNNIKQEVELLMTMPGVKKETAAVVIAEMGTDMSVLETPERAASWTGLTPQQP
ncbi:Transposase [Geobacillus sp. WSUCF1]|nr:Transposase [Geobacillus sp. WSUCF1]